MAVTDPVLTAEPTSSHGEPTARSCRPLPSRSAIATAAPNQSAGSAVPGMPAVSWSNRTEPVPLTPAVPPLRILTPPARPALGVRAPPGGPDRPPPPPGCPAPRAAPAVAGRAARSQRPPKFAPRLFVPGAPRRRRVGVGESHAGPAARAPPDDHRRTG